MATAVPPAIALPLALILPRSVGSAVPTLSQTSVTERSHRLTDAQARDQLRGWIADYSADEFELEPTQRRKVQLEGRDQRRNDYLAKRREKGTFGFHWALFELVKRAMPCSVRHVYYLAISSLLVAKDVNSSTKNYQRVAAPLAEMREADVMHWNWIVDNSRWRRGPTTWRSLRDSLDFWARNFRLDYWQKQRHDIEVWTESDSIAGVIAPVTDEFGIDISPARGHSSISFARSAVAQWDGDPRIQVVLYVGDFDPSGLSIARELEAKLRRYADDADIGGLEFWKLGITPKQIKELELQGHQFTSTRSGDEMRTWQRI